MGIGKIGLNSRRKHIFWKKNSWAWESERNTSDDIREIQLQEWVKYSSCSCPGVILQPGVLGTFEAWAAAAASRQSPSVSPRRSWQPHQLSSLGDLFWISRWNFLDFSVKCFVFLSVSFSSTELTPAPFLPQCPVSEKYIWWPKRNTVERIGEIQSPSIFLLAIVDIYINPPLSQNWKQKSLTWLTCILNMVFFWNCVQRLHKDKIYVNCSY